MSHYNLALKFKSTSHQLLYPLQLWAKQYSRLLLDSPVIGRITWPFSCFTNTYLHFLSVCVFPRNWTHNHLRCKRNALPLSHRTTSFKTTNKLPRQRNSPNHKRAVTTWKNSKNHKPLHCITNDRGHLCGVVASFCCILKKIICKICLAVNYLHILKVSIDFIKKSLFVSFIYDFLFVLILMIRAYS